MTPACCFLMVLEAIKWPSETHQSSEKCIYFQTRLFVPSLMVGFSIDTMPQDLPNSQCIFIAVAAFEHWGVQLNTNQFDSINNQMVKFVVSCCIVFKQVEVSTILVSVNSTGSWLVLVRCLCLYKELFPMYIFKFLGQQKPRHGITDLSTSSS